MFKLTISKDTEKDMKLFGIKEYPFTFDTLKKAYRSKLLLVHPDKVDDSEKKEAEAMTNRVIAAFKKLKNISIDSGMEEDNSFNSTGDIFKDKLMETCKNCNGSGKIETFQDDQPCYDCGGYSDWLFGAVKGKGFINEPCAACNGTGLFTQKYTQKEVTCLRCKGRGYFRKQCKSCNGNGYIKEQAHFHECAKCKGTGKTKMKLYNPVIPEGAVL